MEGKVLWIAGAVFGLAGLGMLAGAGFMTGNTLKFRAKGVPAEGVVVDLIEKRDSDGSSTYSPEVEFQTPDGESHTYVSGTSSNPPSWDRGEKVTLRYDPGNPERVRLDGFMDNWFGPTILGAMGSVFSLLGFGIIVAAVRKRRMHAWLATNGMTIAAQYTGVVLDGSVKVNNRSPWALTAQWQHPTTGDIHTFQSAAIWFDPTDHVQRETLDVLVDADNPTRYRVDISFLPKHKR
jgi:hypothetical protein